MKHSRTDRPKSLHVLVDLDEHRMVDELSASTGQDRSNFMRSLIRREHEARFGRAAMAASRRATA